MVTAVATAQKTWYVYFLCDPDIPDIPFYVGKGSGRRIEHHERYINASSGGSNYNAAKQKAIRQVWNKGKQVLRKKVAEFNHEEDAYFYEWAMIALYHEHLTNVAHGKTACIQRRAAPSSSTPVRDMKQQWLARFSKLAMQEQVYSIDEAAKLLKVNPMTIRRMIQRGEIRASKVGKQYRIPRSEIDKFLDGGQQKKEDT